MHLYKRYWAFYWPLALSAFVVLIGLQIFNAVLARYPDAERELAVFAYAISFIHFLEVGTAFMPQMVMVYARNPKARQRVMKFCIVIGVLFSAVAFVLGSTNLGRQGVSFVYGIEGAVLADVSLYLSFLFPTVLLRTLYHCFGGMLTQNNKTRLVSACTLMGVAIGVIVCLYGFRSGWSAIETLVSAQLSATFGMMFFVVVAYFRWCSPCDEEGFEAPNYLELLRYFWPVSVTGMSFGLGRPVIYAFVSRTPDALLSIAALRVGFDFFMIAQMSLNQFRSLLPSLGLNNLREKRRFMMLVTAVFVLVMAAAVFTPLSQVVFQSWLGLNDTLFLYVKQTLAVIIVTPIFLSLRNYYHGILLVQKKTKGIALGGGFRILTVLFFCWLFLSLGWLNNWTAPLVMVFGFVAETLAAYLKATKKI